MGIGTIAWRAKQWITGNTTDFGAVFNDSQAFFNAGDPPLLSIYDDFMYGNAHSLLLYFYDPSLQPCLHLAASQCARIYVADPNFPAASSKPVDAGMAPARRTGWWRSPSAARSTTTMAARLRTHPHIYQGGSFFGARMLVEPSHTLLGSQVTPFYELYLIAAGAFVLIVGQSGSTQQITDATGRTFFEPGLGGVPTRWDQIRQDAAMRVPNIAPVPSTNGAGASSAQLWYGQGSGATHA